MGNGERCIQEMGNSDSWDPGLDVMYCLIVPFIPDLTFHNSHFSFLTFHLSHYSFVISHVLFRFSQFSFPVWDSRDCLNLAAFPDSPEFLDLLDVLEFPGFPWRYAWLGSNTERQHKT